MDLELPVDDVKLDAKRAQRYIDDSLDYVDIDNSDAYAPPVVITSPGDTTIVKKDWRKRNAG